METIEILCFGDSLTEGFTYNGNAFHPYAESMTTALEKALPNLRFSVHLEGVSGDKVCRPGNFIARMEDRFEIGFYDWVILLGGTNDLGAGESPSKIFTCLQKVQNIALSQGAKILNMTVPEEALRNKDLNSRRDELNQSIREECDDETIFLFDLNKKIPYHSLPAEERDRIWDDGVHFTPAGYDLMGEYLAERLVQIISPPNIEANPNAENTTATQPHISSDSNLAINIAFELEEEENGISEEARNNTRYNNCEYFLTLY